MATSLIASEDGKPSGPPSFHRNRSAAPNPEHELPTVLVVDDVPHNLLALQSALRIEGVDVVTAGSGREALEVLLVREIAVAIIDVMMPEMDGFQLAELIRGVDRTRRIPIIFVTAWAGARQRVFDGYESGAIDFLFKPLDTNILKAKVDVLVSLERQRRATRRALEDAESARAETELLLRMTQSLGVAEDPDGVLDPILDGARDLLGPSQAALVLCDGADAGLRGQRGLSAALREALEAKPFWPAAELGRKPIFIADVRDRANDSPGHALGAGMRVGAAALVPLIVKDRQLGRLLLFWDEPRPFSPHDEELTAALASHAAAALDRAKLRETERRAHQETEQALRYMETFAGILAHDLRNPLWAIAGAAQLVHRRYEDMDGIGVPIQRILTSSARMNHMIEQLLDLTRTRVGGGFELDVQDADMWDLCGQATAELQLAHPEWRIRLESKGEASGAWDRGRLVQVVSNLVANAGQYGASGSEIRVELVGLDSHAVELFVHNEGEIPAELLADLFSPFRRRRAKKSRGLGLGLFITKEIVQAHGGSIDVMSSMREGTTFVVRLPRRARSAGWEAKEH